MRRHLRRSFSTPRITILFAITSYHCASSSKRCGVEDHDVEVMSGEPMSFSEVISIPSH